MNETRLEGEFSKALSLRAILYGVQSQEPDFPFARPVVEKREEQNFVIKRDKVGLELVVVPPKAHSKRIEEQLISLVPGLKGQAKVGRSSLTTNVITLICSPMVAFLSYWLFSLPKTWEIAEYLDQLLWGVMLASVVLTLTALISLIEKRRENRGPKCQ